MRDATLRATSPSTGVTLAWTGASPNAGRLAPVVTFSAATGLTWSIIGSCGRLYHITMM